MGNSVIYRPAYDAEVEYLESTDTQWIDTGVLSEEGIVITSKFKYNYIPPAGSSPRIFMTHPVIINDTVRYGSVIIFASSAGKWISRMSSNLNSNVPSDTDIHTIIYNTVDNVVLLDGEILFNCSDNPILMSESPIMLFGGTNTPKYDFLKGRIYSLSIQINGILVRDFIPVRIGSVGYMYDKVSKQLFANKGTGQFILGNDVSNAVIPQQRCVFYSPMYDAQVEYLASTGTQWIDTKAENCKTFKFRFKALNAKADLKIFGNSDAYPKLAKFTLYQSLFRGTSIPVESNTWYDVEIQELNPPTLKITKGVEVYTGTLPYTGNRKPDTSYGTELPIFGIIESSSNGPFYTGSYFINRTNKYVQNETYFSYFQAFDENGVLIRDFIPVRKGQVGYMYDKVSKQLFTNKGTGSFILGSDTNDAVASQRSVGFERIYEEYEWLKTGSGTPYIQVDNTYNTDENAYIETTYKCNYSNGGFDMVVGFSINQDNNIGIRIFNATYGTAYGTYVDYHKTVNGVLSSCRMVAVQSNINAERYIKATLNNLIIDTTEYSSINWGSGFDNVNYLSTRLLGNQDNNNVMYKRTKIRANFKEYDLVPCKLTHGIPASMDANGIARPAGTCGMWDKVNYKFYGNVANSGTFTVSND